MDKKEIIYQIVGSSMQVHRKLGKGLLEAIYQEALSMELALRGIQSQCEVEVPCFYKEMKMKKEYRMDMVVDGVILELKAVSELTHSHRLQLFNYMRLTKSDYGILINFGEDSLYGERYWYNKQDNVCYLVDRNLKVVERQTNWYEAID